MADIPDVPDSLFTPEVGPTTSAEYQLGEDWSPADLPGTAPIADQALQKSPASSELTAKNKIPRGSTIRKETHTDCRYAPNGVSTGGEFTRLPEVVVAVLANECIAYSVRYVCVCINVYFWMWHGQEIRLYEQTITAMDIYRTVVICQGRVNPSPPSVWTPPEKVTAAPREAMSVWQGNQQMVVYQDAYWKLELPVIMTNRCTGHAKYKRWLHIEEYKVPGMELVRPHDEPFKPEDVKMEPFTIPGCDERIK